LYHICPSLGNPKLRSAIIFRLIQGRASQIQKSMTLAPQARWGLSSLNNIAMTDAFLSKNSGDLKTESPFK